MTISKAFKVALKPGDCAVDVGANVGQSAQLISELVGANGKCISFECHPSAFAGLSALAAENACGNILPYFRAIADRSGHADLFFGDDPSAQQASTIVPELANRHRLGKKIGKYRVETATLDSFFDVAVDLPKLIKIDVEGAEEKVLAGAQAILRGAKPHLIFEFGCASEKNEAPQHFRALRGLGYKLYIIDLFHFCNRPALLANAKDYLFSFEDADLIRCRAIAGNVFAAHLTKLCDLEEKASILNFADAEARVRPNPYWALNSALLRTEQRIISGIAGTYAGCRRGLVSVVNRLRE
jgi:FkbM family methyltransferase